MGQFSLHGIMTFGLPAAGRRDDYFFCLETELGEIDENLDKGNCFLGISPKKGSNRPHHREKSAQVPAPDQRGEREKIGDEEKVWWRA